MSYVTTQPQLMAAATDNLSWIRSAIAKANAAVAGPTTGLTAAAADEGSAGVSNLFSEFGQDYQGLIRQADAFHSAFTQALAAGANAYSQAEAAAVLLVGGAAAGTGAATAAAQTPLLNTVYSLIIGGSGTPIPSTAYVDSVFRYVQNTFNNA